MTYKKSKDSSSFPCKMVSLYVILTKSSLRPLILTLTENLSLVWTRLKSVFLGHGETACWFLLS